MQTPAPRRGDEEADPRGAVVPAAEVLAAKEDLAKEDLAKEDLTAQAVPDPDPAALAPAAEPAPVAPQANGIAQPPAADQGRRMAEAGEETPPEDDMADTERRSRRSGRADREAPAAEQTRAAGTRQAGGQGTPGIASQPEPQAAALAGPAAEAGGVANPGKADDASPVPDDGLARRTPVSTPEPAGFRPKASAALTGPEEPAPAGKAASGEHAPSGTPAVQTDDDADGEAAERVAPAAAAQAGRTGEPLRPADGRGPDERKRQDTDRPEATSGRRGRSAEPRAQDREAGRQDVAADRVGAQAQTQPQASNAAPAAPPAPAAAPAEAGPLSQFVPVVSTPGPQMMAAEVIQKVTAQAHAPGSTVPIHGLAIAVAARAAAGSTRFDIRLDPPELGRIEVQLILDREGSVRSRMVVEKQETLDLLQRDQRNLERALAQAGLDTKDGAIEFTLRDQGSHDRERHRPEQQLWLPRGGSEETPATALPAAEIQSRLAALRGGIDIRI